MRFRVGDFLVPDEPVLMNWDPLGDLYVLMGTAGARVLKTRAMQSLSLRLELSERLHHAHKMDEMRRDVRLMRAAADQNRMQSLADVAGFAASFGLIHLQALAVGVGWGRKQKKGPAR